ncbi:hypothetical protein PR048_003015 [Dryococelus australis]|uniref:Uncharacterized protein n=1 Tax=Dryococelus australis TaxID=614101 RepID=A0ABQ9ILT3_9NEOP|nr:hypothetical protein PR048_003015 [Dryococelus australis]
MHEHVTNLQNDIMNRMNHGTEQLRRTLQLHSSEEDRCQTHKLHQTQLVSSTMRRGCGCPQFWCCTLQTAQKNILMKSKAIANLKKDKEALHEIEIETRNLQETGQSMEEWRKCLTPSNFGDVCKRLPFTGCEGLVNKILCNDLQYIYIYICENKHRATEALQEKANIKIQ